MNVPCAVLFLLLGSSCHATPMDDAPLVSAARAGDVAGIRHAAATGADLNATVGGNGWTPLMHAIHKAQLGSVKALLDAGADPNRRGGNGETPLMMAAGYGYTDIVQLLLRRGANPALKDIDDATAMDYAVAGTSDIDRFTLFRCQDETVRALHAAAPQLMAHKLALRIANVKRKLCSE